MYSKFFLHLANSEIEEALGVTRLINQREPFNEASMLFITGLAEILTNHQNAEYTARKFLNTDHEYRDYIRMMLYTHIMEQGRISDAKIYLNERWREINPLSWDGRLRQNDANVWREMWIGYYNGTVDRQDIFGPLQDLESFHNHPFSKLGMPYSGLLCEAYFYEALLQGVTGPEMTRNRRRLENLNKALETNYYSYYEYHMARYLKDLAMKLVMGS